jgi:hypothetical protein
MAVIGADSRGAARKRTEQNSRAEQGKKNGSHNFFFVFAASLAVACACDFARRGSLVKKFSRGKMGR